jgi:GTPase SAR1 family protein
MIALNKMAKAESFVSMKTLESTEFKSILIIGDVQQGKSTLANIFLGNKLDTIKDKNGEVRIEQKVLMEPYIGQEKKQETLIAYDQMVEVCKDKVTLFDCAGLGTELSIMQLAEILDASDLIKFIFVSTHQALKDNTLQKTLQ